MAKYVYEVLEEARKAKTKEQKIKILKDNETFALKDILKGSYDDKVIFNLPEGTPPYKVNEAPAGTEHTVLHTEARRLWHFVKNADPKLSKTRKEMMYIQMLEGLHADEAKLLINVKEKNLNTIYKGLTDAVVKEAFGWNDDYKTA